MARPKANKDESNNISNLKNKRSKKTSSKTISPPIESNAPVRVGGRMKKAKIVFDPSEHYIPRKRDQTNTSLDNDSKTKLSPLSAPVSPPSKSKRSRTTGSTPTATITTTTNTTPTTSTTTNLITSASVKQEEDKPDAKKSPAASILPTGNNSSNNTTHDVDNYYTELCLICLKNGKQGEKMLNCTVDTCNFKAHVSCLNLGGDDIDISLLESNWQCPHCKTCVVCFENSDDGALTICYVCEDAYHSICHSPRITKPISITEKWKCIHCTRLDVQLLKTVSANLKKARSSNSSSGIEKISPAPKNINKKSIKIEVSSSPELDLEKNYSPSLLSMLPENIKEEHHDFAGFSDIETTESGTSKYTKIKEELRTNAKTSKRKTENELILNEDIKRTKSLITNDKYIQLVTNIPDASNWSFDDVYKYFFKHFPDEAEIFKEQEIDGASLLLMKRSDVINGLQLKLGTAIKIYSHIIMLQTRNNDPRLTWM